MTKLAWPPELVFIKKTVPVELVMMVALLAVLVSWNSVDPLCAVPPLFVIVAVPAVLAPINCVPPPELFVIKASPAVLGAFVLLKFSWPLALVEKLGALEELS